MNVMCPQQEMGHRKSTLYSYGAMNGSQLLTQNLPAPGIEPLTLGSQVQRSPLHYWGLLFYVLIELKSAYRT